MATNSSLLGIPLHNLCIIRNANSSLSNFIIGVPIVAANESGCIIPETNTFPLDKFGAALGMHHFTFVPCQMQTVLLGIAGAPVATLPHLRNTPEITTTSSLYRYVGASLMVADADWSGNHNPQWVFLGLDVNTNLRIKYNNVTLR